MVLINSRQIPSPFLTLGTAFRKQLRVFNPDFSGSLPPFLQRAAPELMEAAGNHLTDLHEFYVSHEVIKSGKIWWESISSLCHHIKVRYRAQTRCSKFPLQAVRRRWHLQRFLLATFLAASGLLIRKPWSKCLKLSVLLGAMSWSHLQGLTPQIFTGRALLRRPREKCEGLSWAFAGMMTFCDLLGTKYWNFALRKASAWWIAWHVERCAALSSPLLLALFPPPKVLSRRKSRVSFWVLLILDCAWFPFASEVPTAEFNAEVKLGKLDNKTWGLLVVGQEGRGRLGVTGRSWGIQ